jgi:hypothetical protein
MLSLAQTLLTLAVSIAMQPNLVKTTTISAQIARHCFPIQNAFLIQVALGAKPITLAL